MFREEATLCIWSVVAWSFVALLIVDWSVQMCVLLVPLVEDLARADDRAFRISHFLCISMESNRLCSQTILKVPLKHTHSRASSQRVPGASHLWCSRTNL